MNRYTLEQPIEVVSKLINPRVDTPHLILSILLITSEPLIESIEMVDQKVLLFHRGHLERTIVLGHIFRSG